MLAEIWDISENYAIKAVSIGAKVPNKTVLIGTNVSTSKRHHKILRHLAGSTRDCLTTHVKEGKHEPLLPIYLKQKPILFYAEE